MRRISRLYKQNIYGVIGTLVFHIIVVSAFLLVDVDRKGSVKEDILLIEFPDILPELEETIDEVQEQESSDEQSSNDLDNMNRTNAASNQLASQNTTTSADEFFDDEYLKEIEDAKRLVSDVSNQLSKEIVDIVDIEMPVETTEGMEPDSIKNVIYSGESNIVYYLENRYHLRLPIPLYLAQGGGKVVVDIIVNKQGKVIEAVARRNNSIRDEQMFLYARAAALRTVFNTEVSAPAKQKGSIHYTFIAQ